MARVRSSHTAPEAPAHDDVPQPQSWEQRLRGFGWAPRPRAGVRDRLVPPFPEPGTQLWQFFGVARPAAHRLARWVGWGGPLLVALVAGVLRFLRLDQPHAVIFDETYYAKDAWSLLQHGYETSWPEDANEKILAGTVPLTDTAAYVVHPPVGKWTIALGEWAFGMTPFGWRFMMAVLGTLSVLMLCRIGRRLFRSTALGCLAGLLMAVDGLHLVMSRTALLDLVVMFWILAAFGCLLVDRDRTRARLAAALPTSPDGLLRPDARTGARLRLGLRPWRVLAGISLGLAFATKWNALYVLAAFGLLLVLWDVAARRTAGAPRPVRSVLRRDALPAFTSLVPVALVVYVASWVGWLTTSGGYYRDWAATSGADSGHTWIPEALRSLWHYSSEVYRFHVGLTSEHTYESHPWSWLVVGRPVSYFYESSEQGEDGCAHASGCATEVLALGTPVLWWAACFALGYALYRWLFRRDWRAGAVLCGVAAGYLPWFLYQERTIFSFYAVVLVPFLCLAVAMMAGALLGPPGCRERRRAAGIVVSGLLVLAVAWNFVYFYPLYTGMELPLDSWRTRMWLRTWI
ncbi:phospholipid carrier-dependent glycosyltransferase [Streptomyces sp. ACA25]|uniref:dolichyl-phosphate-mannose--protein mannosyltransferase n=1 Tax=Streptomyces sp. ACA25 TaxID=3022596 RepID=UPI0023075B4C|nr:phospholipid carrier-dependent glycosyltransferase [Streptomyces sp. ACA25]MDB1087268.1 phospholipid carrier-dependent glycosyltransferase [Streptomyces sp. ACA25]